MLITDVNLLDLMGNNTQKNKKDSGFVFDINENDKKDLYNIVDNTISYIEQLKKYTFNEKDKKDIKNNSFVLLNNCMKNLSKKNNVFIEDANKIYIENIYIDKNSAIFSKGVYKGKKVKVNDMKQFFYETILREGIETAAKYCSLGKIKNKELGKELNL